MKKNIFLISIVVLFLLACNNNNDHQAGENDTAEDSVSAAKKEDALPADNLATINQTGFSKYARLSIPLLNWDKFKLTKFWQEDFQNNAAFVPDTNYFSSYGQFFKYAPDSSKFIDLDSYNISIRKNKEGKLIGSDQEPETEISLIDLKKKEKLRLLFMGPGNSIEDAAWIDNDNLILIGYMENDSATGTNAAIWQFNLSSKNVNLYELSDDSVLNKLRNYSQRVRLKNVLIK
jgi:hypothetical protein